MMHTLIEDLRFGLRMLAKNPGFAAVAVLTLGLGLGANTAIFSVINALMLKALPVKEPGQLVQILVRGFGVMGSHFSYPDFERFRDRNHSFSGVVAVFWLNESLLDARLDGQAEGIIGQLVSGNFFSVLDLRAAAGRLFTAEDDKVPGGHPVAVLSYAFWKRRFGTGSSVLGKSIILRRAPFTIIGVAPAGFAGVEPGWSPDVYVPFMMEPVFHKRETWLDKSSYVWVQIMGRLKPGTTRQQAEAEVRVLFRQMLEQGVKPDWSPKDREEYLSQRLELTSAASGLSGLRREFSQPVFALAGMVGLVLLIACANVASLQLARAVTRQRELAVRRALGAGRIRLVQQLMAESVLLALGGGGLGLLLACWLRDIIGALVSSGPGHVQIDLQLDLRAIGFTLTASLLTTVVFGLVPALRATRLDLAPSLKDDPRALGPSAERARLGKALVVAQVVLSVVLIFGAGLFVRTLRNLETLDPGFNRENVLLFTVDPTLGGYKGQQVADLYRRVLERLDSVPGVRSASLSAITPMWGGKWYAEVWAEGYTAQLNENVFVDLNSVGPNFFETLRIPYLLGRDFGPHDNEKSTKVAVVNKAMARYFFGAQNPIGKKLGWIEGSERKEFEVIGVVGDAKYVDLREQPPQTVYLNCFQDTLGPMSFEVRTASRAAPLVSEIRKVVEAIGKDAQVSGFRTLDEQANESLAHERLIASLAGFFGTLALTLAAVGLYGTMAYTVQRRTNEIGIRMALGAQRGDVLGMILKETLALVLIGACIGLPAALATARLISSMLFGLKPNDPAAVLLPLLVLGVTAAVAGYLPARRASRVDPMVALRYE